MVKIVEDWLLAFRPIYLGSPGPNANGKNILILEDRQIQVIEEQAIGEAQIWATLRRWSWNNSIFRREKRKEIRQGMPAGS